MKNMSIDWMKPASCGLIVTERSFSSNPIR